MHPQRSPWPESLQLPRRSRRVSSSPGGLLPRGPHQNRTRRFPPSGSSADVAHGDAPQIRTRIRGTGRGYRANNATNLGQGSTTFRIAGDMSPDVHAPVMGPFESSHQHGPPLLGRVRGPTRSPTSSLVCSPPTPSLPSAAAPVVPGRWPTLSLCDKEEEGPPRCLGRPLPACRRLRPPLGARLGLPIASRPPSPSGCTMPWAPRMSVIAWLYTRRPTRLRAYASASS